MGTVQTFSFSKKKAIKFGKCPAPFVEAVIVKRSFTKFLKLHVYPPWQCYLTSKALGTKKIEDQSSNQQSRGVLVCGGDLSNVLHYRYRRTEWLWIEQDSIRATSGSKQQDPSRSWMSN